MGRRFESILRPIFHRIPPTASLDVDDVGAEVRHDLCREPTLQDPRHVAHLDARQRTAPVEVNRRRSHVAPMEMHAGEATPANPVGGDRSSQAADLTSRGPRSARQTTPHSPAIEPQPAGCVTLPVTLVGVSNTVQIVQAPDGKWLYSAVLHGPTA